MRPQAYTYQEFMNKSNLQCSLVLRAAAYQSNSVNKGCFTPSSLHPLPPLQSFLPYFLPLSTYSQPMLGDVRRLVLSNYFRGEERGRERGREEIGGERGARRREKR